MKCITILRYLCDHIDELPLGVSTRLTVTHDVPVLLVQLMETKPWLKTSNNQVFEGASWKVNAVLYFQSWDFPSMGKFYHALWCKVII